MCPEDCGECEGCGNGLCGKAENCASCPSDCGLCSFCGNGKCEQYETCTNCNADCGQCVVKSCFASFGCALKCIKFDQDPPDFSLSCVANCLAEGCADTQYFFDQAFRCAVLEGVEKCRGDVGCIMKVCDSEIAACIGSQCAKMN